MVTLLDKRVRKVICIVNYGCLKEGQIYTLVDSGLYYQVPCELVFLLEFPGQSFDAQWFNEIDGRTKIFSRADQ